MKKTPRIILALVIIFAVGFFFYRKYQDPNSVIHDWVSTLLGEGYSSYTRIPSNQQIYEDTPLSLQLDTQLENRYQRDFQEFVGDVKSAQVQLVVCFITPDIGTRWDLREMPFIRHLCHRDSIPFVDFSPMISSYDPTQITFMPKDGHFNARGAELVANTYDSIIRMYNNVHSDISYPATSMPSTFGDLQPNENKILDGGKGIPYHLLTNGQGMRMDYNISFPKTRQRVLLMGNSEIYFAFLDNAQTATDLIQKTFPDKEILNVANWAYTIDDYVSLWQQKAKFTEPDLVILQVGGGDIPDLYFTRRKRFSRTPKLRFLPTTLEKDFYKTLK